MAYVIDPHEWELTETDVYDYYDAYEDIAITLRRNADKWHLIIASPTAHFRSFPVPENTYFDDEGNLKPVAIPLNLLKK